MSIDAGEALNYRRQPEEWPALLELATDALLKPPSSLILDPNIEGLRKLGEALVPLDRTGLDRNLYYAHSLAICNLAQILHEPGVLDKVIDNGADMILEASQRLVRGGISAFGLPGMHLGEAFAAETRRAYTALPENVKLIGNFIGEAIIQRRAIKPASPQEEADLDPVGIQMTDVIMGMYGLAEPALAFRLRGAVGFSAHFILGKILTERTEGLRMGAIPDAATLAFLEHPTIRQTAQRICGLLSPVSFEEIGPVMSVTDTGVYFVDPYESATHGKIKDKPLDPEEDGWRGMQYCERDEPIVCPAAHVNGTVPLVLDSVVKMVQRACERLGEAAEVDS